MSSAAVGVTPLLRQSPTAVQASATLLKVAMALLVNLGRPMTLRVASVMMPGVPSEPTKSWVML